MTIFTLLFSFLFGLLPGLVINNYSGAQAKASDTERKNDINQIYQKLEEHYNYYEDYPTEKELTIDSENQLPGIDPEALIDPNGNFIQKGDYTYEPTGCTAIGCASYTLSATLETEDIYTKSALN